MVVPKTFWEAHNPDSELALCDVVPFVCWSSFVSIRRTCSLETSAVFLTVAWIMGL